jgi:hypothetical protein
VRKFHFIEKKPAVLFLQVDQVEFIKEKHLRQRHDWPFEFPEMFYIDQYLHKNQQMIVKNKWLKEHKIPKARCKLLHFIYSINTKTKRNILITSKV